MKFTKAQIADAFEWDSVNWSKCLHHWEPYMLPETHKNVLTVGEKNGGLSLLFALNGHQVTATDLIGVTENGKAMHKKYGVDDKISYGSADLTNLPFPDNSFDIVACKSVIVMLRSTENQKAAIKNIVRVLKPGGYFLFAENLRATAFHMYLRNKFQPWAHYTLYMDYHEKEKMFAQFSQKDFSAQGFLGTLIPNNTARILLGKIDTFLNPLLPDSVKYILFGACRK